MQLQLQKQESLSDEEQQKDDNHLAITTIVTQSLSRMDFRRCIGRSMSFLFRGLPLPLNP